MRKTAMGTMLALATISPAAVAADKSAPAKPANDRGSWITPADYPTDALAASQVGVATVQLEISEAGVIGGCGVKESSSSPSLDYATCELIKARAQFSPALNKKGKPVASSLVQRIRWQLPERPAPVSAVPYRLRLPGQD